MPEAKDNARERVSHGRLNWHPSATLEYGGVFIASYPLKLLVLKCDIISLVDFVLLLSEDWCDVSLSLAVICLPHRVGFTVTCSHAD